MVLQWIGVAGLVLDFFGFLITAVDLYRDYRRFARRRWLKDALANFERYGRTPVEQPSWSNFLKSGGNNEYRRKEIDWLMYENAIASLRIAYFDATGSRDDKKRPIEEIYDLLSLEDAKPPPEIKKRPPILFGIFLILLGFALQIVAAWPRAV